MSTPAELNNLNSDRIELNKLNLNSIFLTQHEFNLQQSYYTLILTRQVILIHQHKLNESNTNCISFHLSKTDKNQLFLTLSHKKQVEFLQDKLYKGLNVSYKLEPVHHNNIYELRAMQPTNAHASSFLSHILPS